MRGFPDSRIYAGDLQHVQGLRTTATMTTTTETPSSSTTTEAPTTTTEASTTTPEAPTETTVKPYYQHLDGVREGGGGGGNSYYDVRSSRSPMARV